MIPISQRVTIPYSEIQISRIRSRGPGGQNVNKVSTGIHLRFDIEASTLPEFYKTRLLKLNDRRITGSGVIVIKAQRFRSSERNREDALQILQRLIQSVAVSARKREATKPSRRSNVRRLDSKRRRGRVKAMRGRVPNE